MDSVYEIITQWLNSILLELKDEFPHPFTILEPDRIPLPEDYPRSEGFPDFTAGGIFSSPNDMTTTLMGGQVKHTKFKSIYIRKRFKLVDSRKDNEKFFEKLARKIRDRNLDSDFPRDGRDWKEISVNAGIYPSQRDSAEEFADYLCPLKLVYIE